jgi:hypothetical protein
MADLCKLFQYLAAIYNSFTSATIRRVAFASRGRIP